MRHLAAALLAAAAAAVSESPTMTPTMTATMTATTSGTASTSPTPWATPTASGAALPFGFVRVQVQLTGGNVSDVLNTFTFDNVIIAVAGAGGSLNNGRVSVYQVSELVTGWTWVAPFGRRLAAPATLPPGPAMPAGVAPVWVFWCAIDLTYTLPGEWDPPATSIVLLTLQTSLANTGASPFLSTWGILLVSWAATVGVTYATALAGFSASAQAPTSSGGPGTAAWRLGLAYGLAIGLGLLAAIVAVIVVCVRSRRLRPTAGKATGVVYGAGPGGAAAAPFSAAPAGYAQGGATIAVRGAAPVVV
jgi:hypothetical protein